ncbi:MAG: hypothetical protein Q4F34_05025 [Prevotellaceae bacterium]|nr:hypothetical protein [Prevotellaceae bacterium]
MKKTFLLLIMTMSILCIRAQYNDILYLTNSKVKLLQIDQEDDATLLYFTFTSDKETSFIYISDNVRLKADGMDYSLKTAGNIPISHDGKDKSVAGRVGMKVNFILAFEKAPIDKPFDVIENELSTTAFNFHQIKVNTNLRTRRYDMNVFLEDTPLKPRFKCTVDGCDFKVTKSKGLTQAVCFTNDATNAEEAVILFDFLNQSGKPVHFRMGDIRLTGIKKNKEVQIATDIAPTNLNAHRRLWNEYQKELSRPTAESKYVRNRWSLMDVLDKYTVRPNDTLYINYLSKVKPELEQTPLSDKTIADGECYGGYIKFNQKKISKYTLEYTIEGEKYRYNIK